MPERRVQTQSLAEWTGGRLEQVAVLSVDQTRLSELLDVTWQDLDDPNDASPTEAACLAVDGRSTFVLEAAIYLPDENVTLYAAGDFAAARRLFLEITGLDASAFSYIREGDDWFKRLRHDQN